MVCNLTLTPMFRWPTWRLGLNKQYLPRSKIPELGPTRELLWPHRPWERQGASIRPGHGLSTIRNLSNIKLVISQFLREKCKNYWTCQPIALLLKQQRWVRRLPNKTRLKKKNVHILPDTTPKTPWKALLTLSSNLLTTNLNIKRSLSQSSLRPRKCWLTIRNTAKNQPLSFSLKLSNPFTQGSNLKDSQQ